MDPTRFHRLFVRLALVSTFGASAETADAATLTVDRTDDVPAATACTDEAADDCSLRGAIAAANAVDTPTTIVVPAGTYVLSQASSCTYTRQPFPNTFPVTSSEIPLCITRTVTLEGAGADATIIDADQKGRVLFVGGQGVVTLRNLTLRNGIGNTSFGINPNGGGINNHGVLTLEDVVVRDNTLDPGAGGASGVGIYNEQHAVLTVRRSRLTANEGLANDGGGAIFALAGTVTISDSTIDFNKVRGLGGGIVNFGSTMTIANSTISGNEVIFGLGGGIYNQGTSQDGKLLEGDLTIVNSTISGNLAGSSGGGIYDHFFSTIHLNGVTITKNIGARRAGIGGGIATFDGDGIFLANTIVAENESVIGDSEDCDARNTPGAIALTSLGHNLIGNTTNCVLLGDTTSNVTNVSPDLGVLTENGGPTETHAPAETSPVVDAGNPAPPGTGAATCPATDQRGFVRPVGDACDIGSVERGAGLSVDAVHPSKGGNGGPVTVIVSGNGFVNGAAVKLVRSGQPDVVGAPAGVDIGGSALATTFDLAGAALGAWDVVVTNPDQSSETLAGGFVVETMRPPDVWVDVTGLLLRPGRTSRFTIFYGNRGNVDALAVPLWIATNRDFALRRSFEIPPPPSQPDQIVVDWTRVPLDALGDDPNGFVNVPLLLPIVPAGSLGTLQITITPPPGAQPSHLFVDVDAPLFTPALAPAVVDQAVDGARAYAPEGLGTDIPTALAAAMAQYVTTQLGLVVSEGRAAYVASLGTAPSVYSLTQLQIDAALYGAATAAAEAQTTTLLSLPAWSTRVAGMLVDADAWAGQDCPYVPCKKARILEPGCTCTNGPDPIMPPDIPAPPGCDPNDIAQKLTSLGGTVELVLNPPTCRITAQHCEAFGGTVIHYTDGTSACHPNGCHSTSPGACVDFPLEPKNAADPNDKTGPNGSGGARFLVNETSLAYTINFENLETANAPAQVVTVTDQLDATTLDLATFSLGPISFGDLTLTPTPGVHQWTGGVDLRPEQNIIVTVQAGLDVPTGLVTWTFTSIDPDTGQLTEDPDAGFLPPNVDPPEGDGTVAFSVQRKAGLATGATICNEASIVFDLNDPIETPAWCTTIDQVAPTSAVQALPAAQTAPGFDVNWSGSDANAGVADYTVYVSTNGGPFVPLVTNTSDTSVPFTGQVGTTYAFYSRARDLAGNVEPAPASADATIQIVGPEICGNCLDDDLNGKIDALDAACAPSAKPLTITKATLNRGKPIAGDEKLSLKGTVPIEAVDPPANGAALAFVAPGTPDALLACVAIPPGAPGWKVNKKGTVWTFKDDKTGALGDPDSKDKLTIKVDAKKGTIAIAGGSSLAEVTLPAAGPVSVQVTSGASTWERTQGWRLTSKGKGAVTP